MDTLSIAIKIEYHERIFGNENCMDSKNNIISVLDEYFFFFENSASYFRLKNLSRFSGRSNVKKYLPG